MQEGPDRVDYQETRDVTEVHASIKREHSDPKADVTPIPVWLTALCGVVVCWAGAYLGVFHGGFSSTIYNEYDSSPAAIFPITKKPGDGGPEGPKAVQSLAQQGKLVYGQCAACHQGTGMGVPGQFPPLVGSEWVIGSEKRLIAILLKGAQGPMAVKGQNYNGVMPPWEGSLTDKKIAAVASYVRAEWGNAAPEISEAKVAAARKMFAGQAGAFTEAQLLEIPADATLPEGEGGAVPAAVAAAGGTPNAPTAGTAPSPAQPSSAKPAPAAPAAAPNATASNAASAPGAAAGADLFAEGKKNYMMICVACHQPTGKGLPPLFPPLEKTEYVSGDPQRFAAMILKGVAGPITVNGAQYNSMMPGQEAVLTDQKIASILTFVRGSFGNNAPPVGPEVVAEARKKFADRKTPWTEAELLAFGQAAPAAAPAAEAAPAAPTSSAPALAAPASSVPQPEAVQPVTAPVPSAGESQGTTPAAPAAPAPAPAASTQPAPITGGSAAPSLPPASTATPESASPTQ